MKSYLCCILFLTAATASADTIRCKGGIISTGDPEVAVIAKCGTPTTVNAFGEIENKGYRSANINKMEAWVYNFGPYEFMYKIIMRNGIVTSIENLGPGL